MAKKAAARPATQSESFECPRCKKPHPLDEQQPKCVPSQKRNEIDFVPDHWCYKCRKNFGVDRLVERLEAPDFSISEMQKWPPEIKEIYRIANSGALGPLPTVSKTEKKVSSSEHPRDFARNRRIELCRQLKRFLKGKKGGPIEDFLISDPLAVLRRLKSKADIAHPGAHFSTLFPQGELRSRETQEYIVYLFMHRGDGKSDLELLLEKTGKSIAFCQSILGKIRAVRNSGRTTLPPSCD